MALLPPLAEDLRDRLFPVDAVGLEGADLVAAGARVEQKEHERLVVNGITGIGPRGVDEQAHVGGGQGVLGEPRRLGDRDLREEVAGDPAVLVEPGAEGAASGSGC